MPNRTILHALSARPRAGGDLIERVCVYVIFVIFERRRSLETKLLITFRSMINKERSVGAPCQALSRTKTGQLSI